MRHADTIGAVGFAAFHLQGHVAERADVPLGSLPASRLIDLHLGTYLGARDKGGGEGLENGDDKKEKEELKKEKKNEDVP